jgi:hypothetical protein
MNWIVRHVRTNVHVVFVPSWSPTEVAQLPGSEPTRLYGHFFEITCSELHQAKASCLLANLDAWAERIGLDERTIFRVARWSRHDVLWLLEQRRQRDQRALDTPSMTELQAHLRLLEMWRVRARRLGTSETHLHLTEGFAVLEIVWA